MSPDEKVAMLGIPYGKLIETRRSKMVIALIKSYTDKPWRSPETYQLIEDSLKEKWLVKPINTKNSDILYCFITRLKREWGKNIFVFNIAEYLDEENNTGFLPALLDGWELHHLGSNAKAIALGLDKARTKMMLKGQGIPTPQYFVANMDDSDFEEQAERIGYPLIVKPVREGGHIGIREDSIVYDHASLDKIVRRIFDEHDQPALVEEYLNGKGMREFSVGFIDSKTRFFTPIEIDFAAMNLKNPILSYQAAQNDLEKTILVQDKKIRAEIVNFSKRTFRAVGAYDYSRVDLRMNHNGCYVLEISIMPGLGPQSFLPKAAKEIHALEYAQLIQKVAADSMQRQIYGRRNWITHRSTAATNHL
jgi:D-alanine-D-alanine ligase